jgi:hypothetical protein
MPIGTSGAPERKRELRGPPAQRREPPGIGVAPPFGIDADALSVREDGERAIGR